MLRILIYISLFAISCGKAKDTDKPSTNFAEREYRQLSEQDGLEGFSPSYNDAKISRENIKEHIAKLPISKNFSNLLLVDEQDLCPIDWSRLLLEASSKAMKWYGEIEVECSEFIRSKDGEGGSLFEKTQNIFVDVSFQCSEVVIDIELDDLNKSPRSYLNRFITCEGSELKSSLRIEQLETKKLKNSTGYVLSEKMSETKKSLDFHKDSQTACVFLRSRLTQTCISTYSDELISGNIISHSSEKSLEGFKHSLQLNFKVMNVKNNQLRSSNADISVDNWQGDLTVMPSGLKVFDLKQGEYGSIRFNI